MTTKYLDFANGNDANDGSTFVLRKKTLASAITGLTGGDTIRIMASPTPTALSQNATWTNGSDTVTLTSAVTANIDDCETAWTASASVTATASTSTYREGTKSANLVIAGAFTTGLAAYKTLASATDFSGYQQISLLVRCSVGVAANVLQLKLCSDTAGVTAVNTINLPAITGGYWTPVVVDTAGALGSSIQSVALYAASDPGSVTVNLDNIVACKAASSADSITHLSLIGKNNGSATEPWWPIESINGTTIKLGTGAAATASKSGLVAKYYGTTETVAAYKREPVMLAASQSANVSGSSFSSLISIEGGWDTSTMTSQSDVTWVRAADPSLGCILSNVAGFHYWNKLYAVSGGNAAFRLGNSSSSNGNVVGEFGAAGSKYGIYADHVNNVRILDAKYLVGVQNGITFGSTIGGRNFEAKIARMWGISGSATGVDTTGSTIDIAQLVLDVDEVRNFSLGYALKYIASIFLNNTVFGDNSSNDIYVYDNVCTVYGNNCTLGASGIALNGGVAYFTKYGGVADDHRIYLENSGGSIISATDQRHTASGIAWKFQLNLNNTQHNPLRMSVTKIACAANEARTVGIWMRRDNTNVTLRLRVKGGQIAGVSSDVTSAASGAANAWELVSVNFTPTEKGVVEILAEGWTTTNSTNGWIDDLEVS